MKKIAIIIDMPNWAFDIGAKLIKKELENKAIVDIFAIQPEPYNNNLFLLLEDVKEYDKIHFLWRKNLLDFKAEYFINELKQRNINYDNYINFFSQKISTGVFDHMFLKKEEIETYKDVFNKFSYKYYVCSKRLFDIYSNIPDYKKPECIIMDTFDINLFKPANLERFNLENLNNRALNIGWVGNSAWNSKDGSNIDYKGFHTILEPVLNELINEGYNITKNYADKQIKFTPNNEMPNYFKNIDIYITCSYQEGTPRPVLEAMSCGVPIIATDVGIVPDVLGNLQKQFIIGNRTTQNDEIIKQNLKNAIIKLYNNRELLAKLSNENLTNAKKLDSTNYTQVYEKMFI